MAVSFRGAKDPGDNVVCERCGEKQISNICGACLRKAFADFCKRPECAKYAGHPASLCEWLDRNPEHRRKD